MQLLIGIVLIVFVLAVIGIWITWKVRNALTDRTQDLLLRAISLVTEKQLPIAPALFAVAGMFTGNTRRQVLSVTEQLNQGMALSDGLQQFPELMAPSANAAIRVSTDPGNIGAVVESVLKAQELRRNAWDKLIGQIMYLSFVVMMLQLATYFLILRVLPMLVAIFSDFGIALPETTKAMVIFGNWLEQNTLLLLFIYLAAAFWFLCLGYMALSITGIFSRRPGFLNRLSRGVDSGTLLRCVAEGVHDQRPIAEVLEILADTSPKVAPVFRLHRAIQLLDGGDSLWNSLQMSRLIRPIDAALLASAHRAGNEVWALRELADATDRRVGYRLQTIVQVLGPIVLLAIGALVAVFAFALFAPLVAILKEFTQ